MTYIQMDQCRICPRKCGAARNMGGTGVCGVTAELKVARAALHMWEEPCISGAVSYTHLSIQPGPSVEIRRNNGVMIKRISLEPAAIEVSDANAVPPLIFQLPPCKGREVLEEVQSLSLIHI